MKKPLLNQFARHMATTDSLNGALLRFEIARLRFIKAINKAIYKSGK